MNLKIERKVWLCWCNDWEDHYVAKVFDSKEKAESWKTSVDELISNFPDDDSKWCINYDKAREMEPEFKKLGLDCSDWHCSFKVEEMNIQ